MATNSENSSVWVFSPGLDAVCFILPVALGVLTVFAAGDGLQMRVLDWRWIVLSLASLGSIVDHMHTCGTLVPVTLDRWRRGLLGRRLWLIPVALVLGAGAIAFFSVKVYLALLAYFGIFHISRQQWGWLRVLEGKGGEPANWIRHLDRIFFVTSIAIPVYFWQADLSSVDRSYYVPGDMALLLPNDFSNLALAVHHSVAFVFIAGVAYRIWTRRQISIGKMVFLLSNWVWFYGGLILSPSSSWFWTSLVLCHGISYHIHVNSYWQRPFGGRMPEWFSAGRLRRVFLYVIFTLVVGEFIFSAQKAAPRLDDWNLLLGQLMLLSHFAFDTMIWRRSFRMVSA